MANLNPAEERERLTKPYAGMSDGELGRLSEESGELTTMGSALLADEMGRRGLEVPESEPVLLDSIEQQKLVTLRQFRDLPEALLAKGMLESAGIECFLADDNMVRLDWFISNLLGGIKIQVKVEDREAAEEILTQPIPENFDVQGDGAFQQPRCPQCQSLDISFIGLATGFALASQGNTWTCNQCGQQWQ